ncbi:MAG TPA: hypothetical protein VK178_07260 [Opitutaceae bacterium]|nr:hypothetical protein [Opitutaceae bacterium]
MPPRTAGVEPSITWGSAQRLDFLAETCDSDANWITTEPVVLKAADFPLETATGWTLKMPALSAKGDFPLDTTTGWTFDSASGGTSGNPTTTEGGALSSGADLTYLDDSAADQAAATAAGWKSLVRWWANSHGPYTQDTPPGIRAWHTLQPIVVWSKLDGSQLVPPNYFRANANGKGEISTPTPDNPAAAVLAAGARPGWNPSQAWTLFIYGTQHSPLPTEQHCLWAATTIGDPAPVDIEVHGGTATAGMRLVCRAASRTFGTALATGARHLVEVHVAAGAAVGAWGLMIDGVEQTESAVVNGSTVPTWNVPPDRFFLFGGVGAPHFRGSVSEVLLIQTNDATVRSAVRGYFATKFGITLP